MIKLFQKNNHPYLYKKSSITVSAEEYNLNFVWVNLNPQDRIENIAQNIFKDGLNLAENDSRILDPTALRELEAKEGFLEGKELDEWNAIKKSFTYKLSLWADINPAVDINLWYDSALVTQKAQQNTFKMMQGISLSRGVNINLKDLRKLSRVKEEVENIFHPAAQVYYRVDLLKALVVDKMLENSPETASSYKCCVVSDIDVEAMSSHDLFDKRTLNFLDINGYVFNRNGLGNFENSFFIFNKEKKDIKGIHYVNNYLTHFIHRLN